LPSLDKLRSAMTDATWVAEDPEAHLLPHIRRVVDDDGFAWILEGVTVEDAVLVVTLSPQTRRRPDERHADALAIIGGFVESNTFVRAEQRGEATVFEVVTGMLDGDGHFAGHGHHVRLIFNEST
jgi:hypothetical protein